MPAGIRTPRPLYLACSAHRDVQSGLHTALAAWLGVEAVDDRPLPVDRVGLVLTGQGPVLRIPGLPPTRWHRGMTPWRLSRLDADPLIAATGAGPGCRIIDATLGFGHDALVLRAAGASVCGLECHPLLAWLTYDGHARQHVGPPLHLRLGDFREILPDLPRATADVVYFDPLFPAAATGTNPTWAPVRAIGARGRVDAASFEAARRVAPARVVLKLAPGEAAPGFGGPPPRLVQSNRARYAVYDRVEST